MSDDDDDDDDDINIDNTQFSMEEIPLNQIFQKAVVLQRSGDRQGALREYNHFLKVAETHQVDRSLYAEVYANMAAIYAMQGKGGNSADDAKEMRDQAKEAFQQALQYRPSLGSAWVNLALLQLAEGKELGANEQEQVKMMLKEARQCCERALGLDNDDERSRSLANKLIGDIDSMMRQMP
jgi:tetratricopeptide (TPR) repeat protein